MTQEEKAKRYDEAYEKVAIRFGSNVADEIFPELKESEDEKIRKEIKDFFSRIMLGQENFLKEDYDWNAWIAWLDRQSKNNMGISEATKQELEDSLHKALEKETPESCNEFLEKQGEQILANSAKTCKVEQKPTEWSKSDETTFNHVIRLLKSCGECSTDIYKWLKSLKDRVQPKQEWSEDDEKFIHGLIRGLAARRDIHGHTTFSSDCIDITETINWLRKLYNRMQPQNRWKPSDEQIGVIEAVINIRSFQRMHLESLYEQLKKLREE